MLHSLFVKLGMLAAAVALVFWIGWQAPDASYRSVAPVDGSTAGVAHIPDGAESDASRFMGMAAKPVMAMPGAPPEGNVRSAVNGLVDLNRAEAKELESLPGIGPVLAQRVVEHRTAIGRFHAIEDLRAVKGIGPKIFERIKPRVTVAAVDAKGKAEKRL